MGVVGDFAAGYVDATIAREMFVVFNQLVDLGPIPIVGEVADRLTMFAVPAVNGIVGTLYAVMGKSSMLFLGGGYSTKSKVSMAVGSTLGGALQAPVKLILPPVVGFDLVEPIAVGAGLAGGYALSRAM